MGTSRQFAIEPEQPEEGNQLSQIEKFQKLARELGSDESEERFNEALRKVATHRLSHDKPTKKSGKPSR